LRIPKVAADAEIVPRKTWMLDTPRESQVGAVGDVYNVYSAVEKMRRISNAAATPRSPAVTSNYSSAPDIF